MLTIIYCDRCKDSLLEYGEIAFTLFSFICDQFFKNDPLEISTNIEDSIHGYSMIVRFLELKGFVLTTESGVESIQVKPLGFHCFGDNDWKVCRFCVHEEIFGDSIDS